MGLPHTHTHTLHGRSMHLALLVKQGKINSDSVNIFIFTSIYIVEYKQKGNNYYKFFINF